MRLYIVILSILFTYTRVKDKDMSDFITSTAHGPSTRLLMVRFDGAGTLRSGIFYFTTFCYNTVVPAKMARYLRVSFPTPASALSYGEASPPHVFCRCNAQGQLHVSQGVPSYLIRFS